jgi:D-lactate dehydrogenase (quinone)
LRLIRSRVPLPAESRAMLMIEVDGSEHEIPHAAQVILSHCQNEGLIRAERADQPQLLWQARKALSPLLRQIAPKKINEDIVVPVSHLVAMLQGLSELAQKHAVANVNFGHAGNGNLHVNLLVDASDAAEIRRAQACLSEVFDLVLSLNGTLSGEHGVGSEKRAFVPREIDSHTLELMRAIKRVFDPNGILNPGKLFP